MEEPIEEPFRRTQSVLDLVNQSEHAEMAEQPKSAAAVADLIKTLIVKYQDLVDGTPYNGREISRGEPTRAIHTDELWRRISARFNASNTAILDKTSSETVQKRAGEFEGWAHTGDPHGRTLTKNFGPF